MLSVIILLSFAGRLTAAPLEGLPGEPQVFTPPTEGFPESIQNEASLAAPLPEGLSAANEASAFEPLAEGFVAPLEAQSPIFGFPPEGFPSPPADSPPGFSVNLADWNTPVDMSYPQSTAKVPEEITSVYDVLYSAETQDGVYFNVIMGQNTISNPNFLPHPHIPDSWIVVSQRQGTDHDIRQFREFLCIGKFIDGSLQCVTYPTILEISTLPPLDEYCAGAFGFMSMSDGPHDSRVFHGPIHPYTIYGAQSTRTCFGLWIQDLSTLVGPTNSDLRELPEFVSQTELQRPGKYGYMEKNWFVFWDQYNNLYAHYDFSPYRSFARISPDGSAGHDLAIGSAEQDQRCLDRWMPHIMSEDESIHQATNSLSITLCKRKDEACKQTAESYIFHIFHWKTFDKVKFVGHYEPFVVLFKQKAPFELYAVSRKPFWLYGRLLPGDPRLKDDIRSDKKIQEMLYVVSMSWKSKGQKYHGFLDDNLLIGFGIEDERAAGISIVAEDLLRNLGLCSEAGLS